MCIYNSDLLACRLLRHHAADSGILSPNRYRVIIKLIVTAVPNADPIPGSSQPSQPPSPQHATTTTLLPAESFASLISDRFQGWSQFTPVPSQAYRQP